MEIPYEFHFRQLCPTFYGWYRDVVNTTHAFWVFKKAVAGSRPWDYAAIFDLMRVQVQEIVDSMEICEKYSSKKSAREIKANPESIEHTHSEGKPTAQPWELELDGFAKTNILAQKKNGSAARVCLKILKRITDDWYWDTIMKVCPDWEHGTKIPSEIVETFDERMRNRDRRLLFRLMDEHIEGWWT